MVWKKIRRFFRITIAAILLVLVVSFVGLFIITSITPAPFIGLLQKAGMVEGEVNSYHPKARPAKTVLSDGTVWISDIQYGKKYPNSFLDLYLPEGKRDESRPTIVFVHGGGYAWGDKTVGDPKQDKEPHYLRMLAKNGFNVVSINYALTGEYHYPVPLIQLDQAINFLQTDGKNYGLSDEGIIFIGQSAGGQLVGQYVNIQTNDRYAKELGMEPTLNPKAIKGVVFNSALLDASKMDQTNDSLRNYLFNSMGRLYFDTDDLKNEPSVDQADVIQHLDANFPPTYMTDGNDGTFTEQAKNLDKRMDELQIPHEFNYYSRKTATLKHGYESTLTNPYAKENINHMLDFLSRLTDHPTSYTKK